MQVGTEGEQFGTPKVKMFLAEMTTTAVSRTVRRRIERAT